MIPRKDLGAEKKTQPQRRVKIGHCREESKEVLERLLVVASPASG